MSKGCQFLCRRNCCWKRVEMNKRRSISWAIIVPRVQQTHTHTWTCTVRNENKNKSHWKINVNEINYNNRAYDGNKLNVYVDVDGRCQELCTLCMFAMAPTLVLPTLKLVLTSFEIAFIIPQRGFGTEEINYFTKHSTSNVLDDSNIPAYSYTAIVHGIDITTVVFDIVVLLNSVSCICIVCFSITSTVRCISREMNLLVVIEFKSASYVNCWFGVFDWNVKCFNEK